LVIGVLQFELAIPAAQSLKDKRRVVLSLKDRLHREHQVSVAEVAGQEDCQRAVMGVALASADTAYCQSVLSRIVEKLRLERECVLSDHRQEILTGQGKK